jgi:hypothetical protein
MDMFTKVSERLTDRYSNFETKIEEDCRGDKYFAIVNPYWNENIQVYCDDMVSSGLIFYFSYQHLHFDYSDDIDENIDQCIDAIDDFLNGNRIVFEFFCEETRVFGGDKPLDEIEKISPETLLVNSLNKYSSFYSIPGDPRVERGYRCAIRSWDSTQNRDIDFTLKDCAFDV